MGNLTKNADKLLILIYKDYKSRVDLGESRNKAKHIGGLDELHDRLHIKFSSDDTLELIRELSKAKYLHVLWADNTAYMMTINDSLIIYGENHTANNIKEKLEWANTITTLFKP